MVLAETTVYEVLPQYNKEKLSQNQEESLPHEKAVEKEKGVVKVQDVRRGPDGRPVLPPGLTSAILEEAHGLTHCGKPQMTRNLTYRWHPFLSAMIENFYKRVHCLFT